MAYHHELLEQALHLVQIVPSTQANLRRAVSSAYYAVFHLLIAEAVAHWDDASNRSALSRVFDHATMKAASNRLQNAPLVDDSAAMIQDLRFVASTFVQLQQDRQFADYNLSRDLPALDALSQVKAAQKVFELWPTLNSAQLTHDYLVSLLIRPR